MRTTLFVIATFLWGIWFEIVDINGSTSQDFVGWCGFISLIIASNLLIKDWQKKKKGEL